MKVKALIDCVGIGYELKAGEEADLLDDLAKLLLRFGYVEAIKSPKREAK